MDKTVFIAQTFEQADKQQAYWQTRSLEERLQAAVECIKVAYNKANQGFLPMEKKLVATRKRHG